MSGNDERPAARNLGLFAITALAAATLGFAAVYVTFSRPDNVAVKVSAPAKPPAATSASGAIVKKPDAPTTAASNNEKPVSGLHPLSKGEVAAFVFKKEAEAIPAFTFQAAGGKPVTLADWKGKVVLLNLWATWCAPCRKEMPGLERLQKELGSDKFEVVAISVDRTGLDGAQKFLDKIKVTKLGVYADPTVRLTSALKAVGMPTTILIDKQGREIGRLVGPAEWDSAEAKALVRAHLD